MLVAGGDSSEWVRSRFGAAVGDGRGAFSRVVRGRCRGVAAVVVALLVAGVLVPVAAGPAAAQTPATVVDYDVDDDGLIEISSLAHLNAVRWDLDGDGTADVYPADSGGRQRHDPDGAAKYAAAFADAVAGMGCPAGGCVGYELSVDLDFDTNGSGGADSGDDYWNGGKGWAPLMGGEAIYGGSFDPRWRRLQDQVGGSNYGDRPSSRARMFTGVFEGNGRTIANLYIDDAGRSYVGLFGYIGPGAKVRNFGLTAPNSDSGVRGDDNVGALAGKVERARVSGVYSHLDVTGDWKIGGLAGVTFRYGFVIESYATGDVAGWNFVGGLVGLLNWSGAAASYATGDVTVECQVGGGLAGYRPDGHVRATYATGSVTLTANNCDTAHVGGLIGWVTDTWSNVWLHANYATGPVSVPQGEHGYGGLTGGCLFSTRPLDDGANYWDVEASGVATSPDCGVGYTTAQLQAPTGYTGIYEDWNVDVDVGAYHLYFEGAGDDPWDFGTSSQYPVLKYCAAKPGIQTADGSAYCPLQPDAQRLSSVPGAQSAPVTPVVGITSSVGGTEGATVSFTLTASPAPASDLDVDVSVVTSGDFGYGPIPSSVTIPTGGAATVTVTTADDSVDEFDGSVTLTVDAGSGYTVSATQGTAAVDVADDDVAPLPRSAQNAPVLDAQLEADVRSYAAETRHGVLHVNRWKRVLEAFGLEDYAGLEPTTLDEARVHVDIGRPRWIPVLAHMVALDAVDPQPPPARGSVQVDAQVLATARSKAAQTHGGVKHVNRWKRVLEAFGDGDYPGIEPLTAAGAQVYANVWSGWDQVAAQLRLIEAAADPTPVVVPPVVPPVVVAPTPEVGITSSAGGTEGDTVSFTLTAVPAPAADLDVDVSVVTSGDFGYGPTPATVTIPTSGTATVSITTADDSSDEPDGSVTLTINAGSGYTVGASASDSADVVDDDVAPSPSSAQNAPALDAQLEADVRSYAAETQHGTLHVNRWKRVLETFGLEDYPGLEPTTLDEARVHVDIGRPRWIPVLAHMLAMDAVDPQPPPTRGSVQVDAQVLATARSKAAQTHGGVKHVNRWKRVLEAFGDGDYPGIEPLTAAGAQVYANVWSGWDQVAAQLRLIEAAADPTPVVVPPVVVAPTPEVNIVSSAGGTEGATVSFTLTATPVPAADLDVDVSVVTSGDFGYGPAPATVTIPTSGTATVSITTADDSSDEPDGSVTLTINAGSGYTVGAYGSDSVDVTDDDDPVAPVVVVPDPVVSITAGQGITEGGDATFTVTAVPAPAADLDVTVTVAQNGAFGANTGSRTVTVPTGGSVSFTVATTDDTTDESDGSVTATVNTGSGYTVSTGQGAGTVAVADNDVPIPVVSITAGTGVTEGGDAGFTLTAVPAPATALDVAVTITQDGDYGAVTGTRTVTVPTSGSVSFTVATTDDSTDESDGSVTVTVDDSSGYTVSNTQGAGTVNVADNDVPQISITAGQGVSEGGDASFTLTAVPAPAADLPVTVTITQTGDYGAVTGTRTVTIPTTGSVSFTVATTDDATDEPDGSVTVTVDDSSGYTVSNTQGAGTVDVADNDDPPPTSAATVSVADATGSEADWAVDFTVTLSEASNQEVRVRFTTWNWSGLTGRAKIWLDYQSTERTIVFAPGQTEQTVTVYLIDDHRPEPDEYFTVELTNPQGATIGRGAATGTITDDD